MKDLDFEELDKAVNSMISNQPTNVNVAVSSPANNNNNPAPAVSTSPKLNLGQNLSIKPVGPRSNNGRFMDMVRSNASQDSRVPLAMPTRVSNLTQISPAQPVSQPKVQPVVASVSNNPTILSNAVTPVVNSAPNYPNSDASHDDDIDQISLDIENTLKQLNEPQESPFLSGAKVEKRPLNAFLNDNSKPEQAVVVNKPIQVIDSNKISVDDKSVQIDTKFNNDNLLPKNNIPSDSKVISDKEKFAQLDTPLPAELQSDILSIESNESILTGDINDDSQPSEVVNPKLGQPQINTVQPQMNDNSVKTPLNPVVPTSIQQQYVEKPNSGDKENVSIYDTNSYHKAVDTSKNKKGLMFIVWVVLLILASVGAGAAVFFFVLPNL